MGNLLTDFAELSLLLGSTDGAKVRRMVRNVQSLS